MFLRQKLLTCTIYYKNLVLQIIRAPRNHKCYYILKAIHIFCRVILYHKGMKRDETWVSM